MPSSITVTTSNGASFSNIVVVMVESVGALISPIDVAVGGSSAGHLAGI